MEKSIRWGILSTGGIAQTFARGLKPIPNAELAAVGSRSKEKAESFAGEFGAKRAYGSYQELADDPEVDIIYVATPHPYHYENTLMAIEAGKGVLCEKPFAMNARQAKQMIQAAREKKVYLMEAMWTRFLPVIAQIRQWLEKKRIGQVRMFKADFGFRAPWNPEGRLLNAELGGGALLDLGIYPISFCSMIYGRQPSQIASLAHIGETGVDEQEGIVLGYDQGELAVLTCAVRTDAGMDAYIIGTEGKIHIHGPFWCTVGATLSNPDKDDEVLSIQWEGGRTGYTCEAEAVMADLAAGRLENEIMPLDETLAIMETLDRVRAPWGLTYPNE